MNNTKKLTRGVSFTIVLLLVLSLVLGFAATNLGDSKHSVYAIDYVHPEDTGRFNYDLKWEGDFIPGTSLAANGVDGYQFPARLRDQHDINGGAILIKNTEWQKGQNLNLTKFTSSSRKGITGQTNNASNYGVYVEQNNLQFRGMSTNKGHECWKYMFGYIELPQDLQTYGGQLTVTADTGAYFDDNATSKRMFSIVVGDYLYQDKRDKLNVSDIRFNNQGSNMTDVDNGIQSQNDKSDVTFTTSQQSVTIDITANKDKYIRVSYVHFFKAQNGKNYFGQKIENVKIDYLVNNPADYTNAKKFVPGVDIIEPNSTTAFPEGMADAGKGNAQLITGITNNANLDLRKFAVRYKTNGVSNLSSNTPTFENNKISYLSEGNAGQKAWKYMYGYIEVPSSISQNGGTLYIQADTVGYTSMQDSSVRVIGNKYFSAVAGSKLRKTSNMHPDELSDINIADGVTDIQKGKSLDGISVDNLNDSNATTQRVTLNIKPGEKYVRISYVHFYPKKTREGDNFSHDSLGASMTNVKVNFAAYSYPSQASGAESDYVPGISWVTEGVANFNAKNINGNTFESYAGGVPYSTWSVQAIDGSAFGHSGSVANGVAFDGKTVSYTGNGNEWKYIYTYIKIPAGSAGKTLYVFADTLGYNAAGNGKTYLSLVAGKQLYHDGVENPTAMESNKGSGQTVVGACKNSATSNMTRQQVSIKLEPNENYVRISFVAFFPGGNSGEIGQKLSNVRVAFEDEIDPKMIELQGHNAISIDGEIKNVTFKVDDLFGVPEVSYNGNIIVAENGVYSIEFTNAISKTIKIKGANGKVVEQTITPTNFLTAGTNVSIEVTGANTATITVTNDNWAQRIIAPVINYADVQAGENTGLSATFNATFDISKNCTQKIEANYKTIEFQVIANGITTKKPFGSEYTFSAGSQSGQTFVGWKNKYNTIVSTDINYTIKVVGPISLTPVYVADNTTMIEYVNLSGKRIDIRGYENAGSVDEILKTSDVVAPANPYMKFVGWARDTKITDRNVAIPVYEVDETRFTVTIDGTSVENAYFNKRIDLTGSTTGWAINGQKVTDKSVYTVYVTNDMAITKAPAETAVEEVKSVIVNKTGSINVINGLVEDGAATKYKEIGFVIGKTNNEANLVLGNNIVDNLPVTSITAGGQFMVAIDDSVTKYQGAYVRMYTIDTSGNITYSPVCPTQLL